MRVLKRIWFWICWPFLFFYFFRSERTRVIVRDGSKTLLVKGWWSRWYADERWALPGGGLKHGEPTEIGALRELAEEVGLTARPEDLTPLGSGRVAEFGLGYKAHYFLLDLPAGQTPASQSAEVAELMWLDLSEISDTAALKPEVLAARDLLVQG